MSTVHQATHLGTGLSDLMNGSEQNDVQIGLAGNDTIEGQAGDDIGYGDYAQSNMLTGTDAATSFSDYAATGDWAVSNLPDGHQQMSQQVATEIGGVYEINLSLAANFAGGETGAAVEVLADGIVVAEFSTSSGAFGEHAIQFTATDTDTELVLRSIATSGEGPQIDTSGPAFHYDLDMEIGGQVVTVAAFADGQANLYQVLNGTLHVFDAETQTYEMAGAVGTVNVNSMGFNVEDDLLYAIAVADGTDSLGQTVHRSDLIMIDATGNSYRIGETPYRAWTGDFDDQGNLWSFQSSMNHIAVIDVDVFDAEGNPSVTVYNLPNDLVDFSVYDVAYDAGAQAFYGVARPSSEGQDTVLLVVDISSGAPEFSTIPVTSTVVDGVTISGAPAMTFGAAIMDAGGNLYVGGNSGDHDMNNATPNSGGIFRVVIDTVSGEASLHLLEIAPTSYSNDGAADPTAESPFAEIDLQSSVLIRYLRFVATTEGALSYDDWLSGGAGNDTLNGGIGTDTLIGGSQGDTLLGDGGNDHLHGGAGENGISLIMSFYDENGLRYDQFGNLLGEDDDYLIGGLGMDTLVGSAGHDTLAGGESDDVLDGGSGSDVLFGNQGDDTLSGGAQFDLLEGGDGADGLDGGSGDDVLDGGMGNDQLTGGSGNDTLLGADGTDNLAGGSGDDSLLGEDGNDVLKGGSGDDHLIGGAGNDSLDGGSGNDLLTGGDGLNRLRGGSGQDTLIGGDDSDNLNGGSQNDVLAGAGGRDYLNGAAGDDTLDGGAGRDRIYLGAGDDVATGGAGSDRFIFRSEDIDGSTDLITDFSIEEGDLLDISRLNLDAGEADMQAWFAANAHVVDGSDVYLELSGGTTLILADLTADVTEDLSQIYDSILF